MARRSLRAALGRRLQGVRRGQFSLRTLLLLTTACALSLGAYMRSVAEQRAVVRCIRAWGGDVWYEFHEEPRGSCKYNPKLKPHLPQWLLSTLGEDFFFTVTGVSLARYDFESDSPAIERPSAELVRRIAALRKLRTLDLGNAQCDDATLGSLRVLTDLERLFIVDASKVTDAGIARLPVFTKLQYLALNSYPVTDKGLRWLGRLSSLTVLWLTDEPPLDADGISVYLRGKHRRPFVPTGAQPASAIRSARCGPEELANLSGLQNLEQLDLSYNKAVTDDWVRYVAELRTLEFLDLCDTSITSKGVKALVGLRKLKSLHLSHNSSIRDDAFHFIGEMAALEILWFDDACLTLRSLDELKRLKRLKLLDLSYNDGTITEEGARALGDIATLETLWVDGVSVAPSSLRDLTRLKNLRYLSVCLPEGSDILTAWAAQKRLKAALPRCVVSVSNGEEWRQ